MNKKTKAAVLYNHQDPLSIEYLDMPDLASGQVLVQMAASGLCHSQLNEIRGKKGPDRYLPHTLGHEGAGIVEAVGPDVTKVKAGDHVVLTWIKGAGVEVPSTKYKNLRGEEVNSGAIATFMEHAIVSENRVVPITKDISLREASLLGCAIPTGMGIVLNNLKLGEGESIAVFGVGGIGLSVVMAAKFKKAGLIIAVDIHDHKLEQAQKMGATHIINASKEDPLDAIRSLTGNAGVDYAVESAGVQKTMESAFQSVRNQGGLCVLAGNLSYGEKISLDPFDLICGKRIVGTWGGESSPDNDIKNYVDHYLKGQLKLEELITHEFKLDDINIAFRNLEDGYVGRALILMNGLTPQEAR